VSLLGDPDAQQGLISLGLLLGAYFAARFVSYLLGLLVERAARQSTTNLDDRLLSALKQPITYLLFIAGAWGALHRLPGPEGLVRRLDAGLFVIGALLVTLALMRTYGILLSWYTSSARFADGSGLAAEFGPMLKRLGQLFLAALAAIAILQRLGVNVMSLVVSLGVGSLAVGLAAQDTLANMFAGFALMLDRPFRIGDRIQLASGDVGDVEQVGMRATRIKTLDETILVVPNSVLVKERLVNQSRPTRAIVTRLEVGVGFDADLAQVRRILTESALALEHVDPQCAPVVLFARFTDYAIVCRLVFWAKDYASQGLALSEAHEQVQRRFREAGVEIACPRRRIIEEGAEASDEV
jgi:small-conductance mechanosensitive channel